MRRSNSEMVPTYSRSCNGFLRYPNALAISIRSIQALSANNFRDISGSIPLEECHHAKQQSLILSRSDIQKAKYAPTSADCAAWQRHKSAPSGYWFYLCSDRFERRRFREERHGRRNFIKNSMANLKSHSVNRITTPIIIRATHHLFGACIYFQNYISVFTICLAELRAAMPDENVAQIALDDGIIHLGRLAAHHRARFGGSPADDLAPSPRGRCRRAAATAWALGQPARGSRRTVEAGPEASARTATTARPRAAVTGGTTFTSGDGARSPPASRRSERDSAPPDGRDE